MLTATISLLLYVITLDKINGVYLMITVISSHFDCKRIFDLGDIVLYRLACYGQLSKIIVIDVRIKTVCALSLMGTHIDKNKKNKLDRAFYNGKH